MHGWYMKISLSLISASHGGGLSVPPCSETHDPKASFHSSKPNCLFKPSLTPSGELKGRLIKE